MIRCTTVKRGSELTMDHATAAQQHLTERYLLNELNQQARDEFEEHFFDCADCASDIQTASVFIENSKKVWTEKPVQVPRSVTAPRKASFLEWLRPAFAAPAL